MNVLPPNYRHIYTTEYQWVVGSWLPGRTNTAYVYYRLLHMYFSYWIYLWASMNPLLAYANSTWMYYRLTTGIFNTTGYQWVVGSWLPGQKNIAYIYYRRMQVYFSYWIIVKMHESITTLRLLSMNVLPPNYKHIYTTEYQWVVSSWLPGRNNTVYIYYRLLHMYFSYWIYLWASMNPLLVHANSVWMY